MSHSRSNFGNSAVERAGRWFAHHEGMVPWAMFAGLVITYLAFPTRNYYWDGITFAQAIEDAQQFKSLIHPSHLLYNATGYIFYHALHTIGFNVRAITALQVLNGLLSAAAAVVFFFTHKSIFRSLYLGTFLTLLFALSATWWKFSTDADAYIISVLFILIAFRLIIPTAKPRPIVVAFLYSLSMCFHELAIFFGPVVIVGLLYQQADRNQKLRSVLQFSLVSVLLTTAAYLSCFYVVTHTMSPRSFLHWITYYSPDASLTFNIWNDLFYTIRGHFRLFLSGRLNLLQGLISPIVTALIAILAIDLSLLVFLVIRRGISSRLGDDSRQRPLLIISTVWFLIYLAFLFVWLPQNTFYRLFYLPALIILIGLFASWTHRDNGYRPHYRLATLTIAAALANFLLFIYPYSHADKFPPTRFALEMNEQWRSKTLVYYDGENSDNNLVRYFAPATTWVQLEQPNALPNELGQLYSEGWTVWLETTAIDRLRSNPSDLEWLKAHEKWNSRRALENKGFRMEFVQVVP